MDLYPPIENAWNRLLALLDTASFLGGLLPSGSRRLAEISKECDTLRFLLDEARGAAPADTQSLLAKAEILMNALEQQLLGLDSGIPMVWFRRQFQLHDLPQPALAHYVRLLVRHVDEVPERRDRIDYLLTRLLSAPAPNGRRQLLPRAQVQELLASVLDGSRATPRVIDAAAAFFHAAIQRLETVSTLEALFSSNLLIDTRAYKLTLREAFFDPDIIYEACALNLAIEEKVWGLAHQEGKDEEEIAWLFYQQVDQRLRLAFTEHRALHPALEDRFDVDGAMAESQALAARRAIEEMLRRRLEELYAARLTAWENDRFAVYGEVAAGLSHGLKTPLASIRAIAQVAMLKLGPNHPAADHLESIIDEVDRLLGDIRCFLQAASPAAPNPIRLHPGRIVEVLHHAYAPEATRRGLRWIHEVAPGLGEIYADPALLEMATRNIVENALAAAPAESTIWLAAGPCEPPERAGLEGMPPPPGPWMEFVVRDQGPGIAAQAIPQAQAVPRKRGGAGLGIAIARRIFARHGGTLRIETGPHGTAVHLLLPTLVKP